MGGAAGTRRAIFRQTLLAQAELLATDGPGDPAIVSEDALRDCDLLFARRLVRDRRVRTAAVLLPGRLQELQAAVEAVAVVGAPVAVRLALGEHVPHARAGEAGRE